MDTDNLRELLDGHEKALRVKFEEPGLFTVAEFAANARAAVEALFAHQRSNADNLREQVADLTRERDEANYLLSEAVAEVKTQRDEVKALTEALAQARRAESGL